MRRIEDGKLIYNLESNFNLRQILTDKVLPIEEDLFVQMENNFYVPVKLMFPPKMSPNTKYPMLIVVNRSPGSQEVSPRY